MADFGIVLLTNYGESVSRVMIMIIWLIAALSFWKNKVVPRANQALAGSLALVLSHGLIVFQADIPFEVLLFFIACAQATVVSAFLNIMKAFRVQAETCQGCPNNLLR